VRLVRTVQFGEFSGEFPLTAFQFGEFFSDLACPESPVKRRPGIEGRENRDPFLADVDAGS